MRQVILMYTSGNSVEEKPGIYVAQKSGEPPRFFPLLLNIACRRILEGLLSGKPSLQFIRTKEHFSETYKHCLKSFLMRRVVSAGFVFSLLHPAVFNCLSDFRRFLFLGNAP